MMRASRKAREDLLFRTPGVNPQPWKADLLRRRTTQAQAPAPRACPNPHDSLNDLPLSLRQNFQRARDNATQWTVEEIEDSTAMFSCFMTGIDNPEEGKKVLKSIHYDPAPPDVQKGLQNWRV